MVKSNRIEFLRLRESCIENPKPEKCGQPHTISYVLHEKLAKLERDVYKRLHNNLPKGSP